LNRAASFLFVAGFAAACAGMSATPRRADAQTFVYAWGYNPAGAIGDGTTIHRSSPTLVSTLTGLGVTDLAAGDDFSMALRSNGTVRVWGFNGDGRLGIGGTDRWIPVEIPEFGPIPPDVSVTSIAAGTGHGLAAIADGTVRSWGGNAVNQLGNGNTIDRSFPVVVTALSGVLSVEAGSAQSHALMLDGTLRAWGANSNGQLGDGTTTQRSTSVPVLNLTNVVSISGGQTHTLAIRSDGSLWGWGSRFNGRLGDGASAGSRLTPAPVAAITNVIAASAGGSHSLVVKSDGTVWSFGINTNGQLGDGTTTQRTLPVQVPSLSNIVAVQASLASSYALSADGRLWSWGINSLGQLGIGNTVQQLLPVEVAAPPGLRFVKIATGQTSRHVLALLGPPAPVIRLNSPSTAACNSSNTLTVTVDAANYAAASIAGGQFVLAYDATRLSLVSVTPGADLSMLYQTAPGPGQLDFAVRTGDFGPLVGSQTMATLTFNVSGPDACNLADLVSFRTGNLPPTRLTDDQAQDLGGTTLNLGGVTLDHDPPAFPVLSAFNGVNDANLCSRIVSLSATASDTCSGSVQATAKIGALPITFPRAFDVGTTTVTWTATDTCGNTSTTTQDVVIADTQLPSLTPPSAINQNADAGSCTLTLTPSQLGSATALDNCPGVGTAIPSLTLNGPEIVLPATFPTGTTTVFWRVTDAHGNTSQATQSVTVQPFNTVIASVQELGLGGTSTRGITFALFTAASCPNAAHTTCENIAFTGDSGTVSFSVPCGAAWTGVTATDTKHTLRRTVSLGTSGAAYTVGFTSATNDALVQGNVNNDVYVDILDFGGYIGQLGSSPGASTLCLASGLNADFSGSGGVDSGDFTFLQFNFLQSREADPCGGSLSDGPPIKDIAVADLVAGGLRAYANADFNLDGRLNAADITHISIHGLPRCAADFNGIQSVDTADIFSFLGAWFVDHPRADIDSNNTADVQDILSFVNVWFQGC
jgi:alpha-tubulin suppressor-like RCC1 family protein